MTTPGLPPNGAAPVAPPAREAARSGREVLERVMRELSRLPAKVDRGPVLASLGGALAALIALDRSDIDAPDHIEILRAAVAASERAHAEMSKAEGCSGAGLAASMEAVHGALSAKVEPTIELILRRQDRHLRRAPSPRAEAPPRRPELHVFLTSAGVPRLFSFEREPLGPLLRVGPSASAVREAEVREAEVSPGLEEEEAAATGMLGGDGAGEAPPGSLEPMDEAGSLERELDEDSRGAAAALSAEEAEKDALGRLARDTAEELGSLGLLRVPVGLYTAWSVGPRAFEDRLLAHLDAFMALAEPIVSGGQERRFDVLTPLLAWAGDAMVPDPSRAFARAFVLGCLAGDDTAAAAVMALRQSHPLTHDAQRDALSLSPHPGIAPLLERMIPEETPALAAVGLSVLERRGQVAFEAVAPLLSHPAPVVRAAAARALRAASAGEVAKHLLVQHAATEEDEAALAATAESLVVLGSRRGLDIARAELAEEARFPGALPRAARASHLRILALAGGPSDGDLLLASLGHDPIAAASLGFFGDAALVPAMLSAFSESAGIPARAAFCAALARALQRITGLYWPPEGEPRTSIHLADPPLDPGFWARAWEEKRGAFAARRRYRLGAAFSPLQTIAEAETPELPAARRGDLLLELSIVTRGASRAHPGDWVARQALALAELRERMKRGGDLAYPEGQWPAGVLFEP